MNTSLGLLQVTHKQTHMFLFSVSEQQRTTARNICPKTLEFIGIFAMVYKNFPCYRVLFITQCPVRKRRVYRGIQQHPRTVATTTSHNNKLVVLLLLISIQLTSDSMWFALNILSYVCVFARVWVYRLARSTSSKQKLQQKSERENEIFARRSWLE